MYTQERSFLEETCVLGNPIEITIVIDDFGFPVLNIDVDIDSI